MTMLALCALLAALPPGGGAWEEPPSTPRHKLVQANRILAMEGLVGPFGHVSLRSPTQGRFWIADHRSPDSVTLDDIVEVDVQVTPEAVRERGLYREIFIHSSIYARFPEVGAVVHTHSPHAVALGTLEVAPDGLKPTTNPGANIGNFIPVFPSIGLIGTPERGAEVAASLRGQNGVLLRGHGAVVVGLTLEQAVLRAIYLELEARTQLLARSAGRPVSYNDSESELFRGTRSVEHAWRYYLGKLERLERMKP